MGQQAFLGQVAERFAQRIARYIQTLRQRRLGQPLAGREFTVDQPAAYLFGDFVGQGLVRVRISHRRVWRSRKSCLVPSVSERWADCPAYQVILYWLGAITDRQLSAI
ncbi:hypothetical protein G6F31_015588 [Rhizopus arrhizus]|nr:hypothetical protein G6F31_015588 [Rhizopus arrhizus]